MIRRTQFASMLACLGFIAIAALTVFAQQEHDSDLPRVKPDELKKMIETNAADFLVVSNDPQESYDEGHIPGAVSLPWVSQLKGLLVNLPRNKTLILYCSCAHEEDSSGMAAKLARFGYRNIRVLDGGFLKWMELKYPVEKK